MKHPGIAPKSAVRETDIAAIAHAYGLALRPEPVRQLGGAVNRVVLVATTSGEIVFRIHRSWETIERLDGVHRVQDRLRQFGLPVPSPLRTIDGATSLLLGDRLVEALPYAGPGHEADTEIEFAQSFTMLGRLHQALAKIPPESVPPPVFSSYADPDTALAMLAAPDAAFVACSERAGYVDALAVRRDVRLLYERLREARAGYAARLPRSFIHGDFLGMNVLLHERGVSAILDFDRLAYRDRVIDLATSLSCAFSRLDRRQPVLSGLRDDQVRQLARWLDAYTEAASMGLTADEVTALPFEMARVQLFPVADAGYLAAAGQCDEAIGQTRAVAWHLPRAWWLIENAERIRRARH
jgi:Ser/Thr protein kinase RdoA (MazF antagonist)